MTPVIHLCSHPPPGQILPASRCNFYDLYLRTGTLAEAPRSFPKMRFPHILNGIHIW